MALIDTHLTVKEFIAAGMSEEHAEAITRVVARIDNQVASKSDITDLKSDVADFKNNMSELKSKIAKIETGMLWIQGLLFIIVGLLLKPILF